MWLNIIIILVGLLMGLAISLSLIYVNKFKEYMIFKREEGSLWLKLFDATWRIFLPVAFGLIVFVGPIKLLCLLISEEHNIKQLISIYLFTFFPSFFIFIFLLIKKGKIQVSNQFK